MTRCPKCGGVAVLFTAPDGRYYVGCFYCGKQTDLFPTAEEAWEVFRRG